MKVSYKWLQTYFKEELPQPEVLVDFLTMNAFESEGIEKVGDDKVIDLDVLPNRAHDCLSHFGIAKEISLLAKIPLKKEDTRRVSEGWQKSKLFKVSIDDKAVCSRYTGVVIKNIKVKPSPEWLKQRLESLGQKSINNIVDATNYVMLSFGQPLHAYDMNKMEKEDGMYHIAVRDGENEETMTALDNIAYSLGKDNLLIIDANSDKLLGIAGIKGGKAVAVGTSTQNIILEAANFDALRVRKTSQELKLRTDASIRFENEITPELTMKGMEEVVKMILSLAGGEVEGYVDLYPTPRNPYKIGVSLSEVNKLLGTSLSEDELTNIFDRLDFDYKKVHPRDEVVSLIQKYVGVPYKFGASVSYDAPHYFDCSSLISFAYLESGISLPRMSIDQYVYGEEVAEENITLGDLVFSRSIKNDVYYESIEFMKGTKVEGGISHCGMYLGDGKVIHASGKESQGRVVIEDLATSPDFETFQGYRRIVTDNEERFVVTVPDERLDLRNKEDLIEEVGRVYGYTNIEPLMPQKSVNPPRANKTFFYTQRVRDILVRLGFSEVYNYAFRSKGEVELQNPLAKDKAFLRANLRDGMRESLEFNGKYSDLLAKDTIKIFEVGKVFHSDGEHNRLCVGVFTPKIKPKNNQDTETLREALLNLQEELSINIDIDEGRRGGGGKNGAMFEIYEIDFDRIVQRLPELPDTEIREVHFDDLKTPVYKKISPYPFMLRDLSLWVLEDVGSEAVIDLVRSESGELLVQTKLFDEFSKDGKVSYAYRLVFQSVDKTLTNEEVNVIMEKITKILNDKEGWEVR